jgi:hypothetical protein
VKITDKTIQTLRLLQVSDSEIVSVFCIGLSDKYCEEEMVPRLFRVLESSHSTILRQVAYSILEKAIANGWNRVLRMVVELCTRIHLPPDDLATEVTSYIRSDAKVSSYFWDSTNALLSHLRDLNRFDLIDTISRALENKKVLSMSELAGLFKQSGNCEKAIVLADSLESRSDAKTDDDWRSALNSYTDAFHSLGKCDE